MRKQPNRSTNSNMSVSQRFTDGKIAVLCVENVAEPGYQPVIGKRLKGYLFFEEQRVGVQRFYQAKQAQQTVAKVIRVPKPDFEINAFDIVQTLADGKTFRIDMVQIATDVFPKSLDLTLSVAEQGGGC